MDGNPTRAGLLARAAQGGAQRQKPGHGELLVSRGVVTTDLPGVHSSHSRDGHRRARHRHMTSCPWRAESGQLREPRARNYPPGDGGGCVATWKAGWPRWATWFRPLGFAPGRQFVVRPWGVTSLSPLQTGRRWTSSRRGCWCDGPTLSGCKDRRHGYDEREPARGCGGRDHAWGTVAREQDFLASRDGLRLGGPFVDHIAGA